MSQRHRKISWRIWVADNFWLHVCDGIVEPSVWYANFWYVSLYVLVKLQSMARRVVSRTTDLGYAHNKESLGGFAMKIVVAMVSIHSSVIC